jgi:hypothetical protein
MTEPAPTDQMQLGEMAKRLLDDPVLNLALDRIQQKLADTWRNSAVGEVEAREAAYRMLWAAEHFKSELRIMLGNARAIEAKARLNERSSA